MVELAGHQSERTEAERKNILRWEDDGGQAIEDGHRADRLSLDAAGRNFEPMTAPANDDVE